MKTISDSLLAGHPEDARTSFAATINVNVSTPEEDRNNSTMSDLIDEAPPSSNEAQPPDEVSVEAQMPNSAEDCSDATHYFFTDKETTDSELNVSV